MIENSCSSSGGLLFFSIETALVGKEELILFVLFLLPACWACVPLTCVFVVSSLRQIAEHRDAPSQPSILTLFCAASLILCRRCWWTRAAFRKYSWSWSSSWWPGLSFWSRSVQQARHSLMCLDLLRKSKALWRCCWQGCITRECWVTSSHRAGVVLFSPSSIIDLNLSLAADYRTCRGSDEGFLWARADNSSSADSGLSFLALLFSDMCMRLFSEDVFCDAWLAHESGSR